MIKCLECGHEASAKNALGYHLRTHGMTYEQYVVKHQYNGMHPACECGCGTQLKIKKGGFGRFLNRSHATAGKNNPMAGKKGKDSPNTGKVRTPEMRKRYSKAAHKRWADESYRKLQHEISQSPGYRELQSKAQRHSFATTDHAKKIGASIKQMYIDRPELREVAREHCRKLQDAGKFGTSNVYHQYWKYNPFTGEDEFVRSSWEARFLDECVSHGRHATLAHSIRIPYIDSLGNEREYWPDFWLRDDRRLVEVKGAPDPDLENKIAAALLFCSQNDMDFEVVRYDETESIS